MSKKTAPKPQVTKKPVRKPVPKPTRKPVPKPAKKPPAVRAGVHPGAFCSPEGAYGTTSKGTPMRCTSRGRDQARWRSA
ncbi:hypothetical protein Psi02_53450 [Planotetraspora silvatica]|uniref:Uncharacterized protein n=1 Tax=Planotetraspora silvatica TaxID=234614 RepID=A0A8J3XQZ2_9ACTN|nr:hypothetical protein Psi02_53450 [Planotetraspora silvatica]